MAELLLKHLERLGYPHNASDEESWCSDDFETSQKKTGSTSSSARNIRGRRKENHAKAASAADIEFWFQLNSKKVQGFLDWIVNSLEPNQSIAHELTQSQKDAVTKRIQQGKPLLQGKELENELASLCMHPENNSHRRKTTASTLVNLFTSDSTLLQEISLKQRDYMMKDLKEEDLYMNSVQALRHRVRGMENRKEILTEEIERAKRRVEHAKENLRKRNIELESVQKRLEERSKSIQLCSRAVKRAGSELLERSNRFSGTHIWQALLSKSSSSEAALQHRVLLDEQGEISQILESNLALLSEAVAHLERRKQEQPEELTPLVQNLYRVELKLCLEKIDRACLQAQQDYLSSSSSSSSSTLPHSVPFYPSVEERSFVSGTMEQLKRGCKSVALKSVLHGTHTGKGIVAGADDNQGLEALAQATERFEGFVGKLNAARNQTLVAIQEENELTCAQRGAVVHLAKQVESLRPKGSNEAPPQRSHASLNQSQIQPNDSTHLSVHQFSSSASANDINQTQIQPNDSTHLSVHQSSSSASANDINQTQIQPNDSTHLSVHQSSSSASAKDISGFLGSELSRLQQAVDLSLGRLKTVEELEADIALVHKSVELKARAIYEKAFQILAKKAALDAALQQDQALAFSRNGFVNFYSHPSFTVSATPTQKHHLHTPPFSR